MTTYRIVNSRRLDDHGVVQLLEQIDEALPVGAYINVSLLVGANSGLNGNQQLVISTEPFELVEFDDAGLPVFDYDKYVDNQVIFVNAGVDLDLKVEAAGRITYEPTVTWIVSADVTEFLGIAAATAYDTAFLASCVNAANIYAYRKRAESNYHDDADAVPDAAVKLGTVLYAAALYRERGSVDSFASFEDMSSGQPPFGSMGRIKQLLGINRPSVG